MTDSPNTAVSRRRPLAMLLPVVAVSLVVGVVAGSAAANVLGGPVGPSAPPPIPADFPNGSQRYLPDVTVAQIAHEWLEEGHNWACEQLPAEPAGEDIGDQRTDCAPVDQVLRTELDVAIYYDDEEHVTQVTGNCRLGPGSPICKDFFSELGGTVLSTSSDSDLGNKATKWAGKNVDNDSSTTIGNVRLTTSLEPPSITCVPAA